MNKDKVSYYFKKNDKGIIHVFSTGKRTSSLCGQEDVKGNTISKSTKPTTSATSPSTGDKDLIDEMIDDTNNFIDDMIEGTNEIIEDMIEGTDEIIEDIYGVDRNNKFIQQVREVVQNADADTHYPRLEDISIRASFLKSNGKKVCGYCMAAVYGVHK